MCFKRVTDINNIYNMRNLFKILLLTFCGMVAITSCSDDSDGIPGWPWNDNSTEGPENPDVTEIKPRYVWIDAQLIFRIMRIIRRISPQIW